ncbi:MAG TPA: tryptophan synthase subunit alpha [Catalimonadaceae bacterium]|nr:tryptophan synthase subunit alpha [Catalimonadaceae bacterium]
MSNRLTALFAKQKKNFLSVYYTAGFPHLEDTLFIAREVQNAGADLIEIGIPFSDPVADGPVIQASNEKALENGMSLKLLFSQIEKLRETVTIPVLLMGYFNPVYQFGVEAFCKRCQEVGIDGLIIPDMPLWEYENQWKIILEQYGLFNIFLVTPQTSEERIRKIDELSSSFIYLVSSSSVTGAKTDVSESQVSYFNRIHSMQLKSPTLIGFGISSKETFDRACRYADGAIIGSAFINILETIPPPSDSSRFEPIHRFVTSLK